MNKNLYIGVSGFSYPGWKGNFYPKDLKSEDFLSFYSKKLNSVEINSSFYAPPSSAMIKSWSSKTQDSFKFSMKAPRQITHILKLGKGAADSAQMLDGTLELLAAKRGPVLFQLPPFLRQDLKLLETFLGETSAFKQRVFEFRHDSWMNDQTYKLLDKNDAGFCIAETEEMKPVLKVIGGISYYRLRNERYDDKRIDAWSKKIIELSKDSKHVFAYLRHDETGDNASKALRLMEEVSGKI
jgi:uncharacterized protein YecE (DUF72 family)